MTARIPTLDRLPPPPSDRTGWPWTETSQALPTLRPDGSPWPRISIVTPSFNQAQFLEETIRSVLLQCYPNLEYLVIDGGSTDGSVAIIERYAPYLAYWCSEPDRGQSHAINKGFARATGEWLGWLNSDDCYAPGALHALMAATVQQNTNFVAGACIRFQNGEAHQPKRNQPTATAFLPATITRTQDFDQPACLWQHTLFDRAGPLDEDFHYVFDWRFFNRCGPLMAPTVVLNTIACYRLHSAHKTGSGGDKRWREVLATYDAQLSGDDRVALRRLIPWLGPIRRVKFWRQSFSRYGAQYVWRLVLRAIRFAVIDRDPPVHPNMIKLLELPFPRSSDTSIETRGQLSDGTVDGALKAFQE